MTTLPRVMLLAPQFWISGTVTLARELQLGWPADRQPVIACPTRSGRPSTQWGRDVGAIRRATHTSWKPDIMGTAEGVLEVARDAFDLVHVTEPDIPAAQRDWWHDTLERLPVPWTLTLNGNTYPDVDWQRIINARRFTGVVWHTPGHVPPELRDARRPLRIVSLPRPYTLRHDVSAQLPRLAHPVFALERRESPVIGTHCRIAPDKGVALVAALARHIGACVCVDGAPQAGAMPYTLTIQRSYLPEDDHVPAEARWVSDIGPGRVSYMGSFTDGVVVAREHDVHVSATRLGFSAGHEYSLLEAVDAGCVIVQPEHMTESGCPLNQHTYPWDRRGVVGALLEEHRALSDAVRDAVLAHESWYDQSRNRTLVAEHHDPGRLVRAFMDEVLAVI